MKQKMIINWQFKWLFFVLYMSFSISWFIVYILFLINYLEGNVFFFFKDLMSCIYESNGILGKKKVIRLFEINQI